MQSSCLCLTFMQAITPYDSPSMLSHLSVGGFQLCIHIKNISTKILPFQSFNGLERDGSFGVVITIFFMKQFLNNTNSSYCMSAVDNKAATCVGLYNLMISLKSLSLSLLTNCVRKWMDGWRLLFRSTLNSANISFSFAFKLLDLFITAITRQDLF